MLREYHFSFNELLDLELRRFWFLYGQIERLRSEDDLRQISLLASVSSQEGFEKKVDALGKQMGEIFFFDGDVSSTPVTINTAYKVDETKPVQEQEKDPEYDRDKFMSLRAKFASGQ